MRSKVIRTVGIEEVGVGRRDFVWKILIWIVVVIFLILLGVFGVESLGF